MTDRDVKRDAEVEAGDEINATEAGETSQGEPIFRFGGSSSHTSAQEQYKRLIDAEAGRQGLPLAHIADRIAIGRSRLHKVIRGQGLLREDLRDRLFEVLGIDAVLARFCVALLDDYKAYANPDVFLTCEAMKGFYTEIVTRQRGEILVSLRPSIIHETQRRAYDMLLTHQARVLENEQSLQA